MGKSPPSDFITPAGGSVSTDHPIRLTYIPVKCLMCGHGDSIRSDFHRPKGGIFFCDGCDEEREYGPCLMLETHAGIERVQDHASS